MEQFYTVTEAAKILRVRRDTVYGLIRRGEIPAVRLGKLIRIPESAFHATANTEPERQEPPAKHPVILKIKP